MSEQAKRALSAQESANELFAQAAEEKVVRQQISVETAKKTAPISRQHIVLVCLAVALPIFAVILAVNVFGITLSSWLETPPSPAVAREEAVRTMEMLVGDVEAFRKDYDELPESLVEIGVPPRGTWTYSITGKTSYRLYGVLYGQSVSFDSAASPKQRMAKEQQ